MEVIIKQQSDFSSAPRVAQKNHSKEYGGGSYDDDYDVNNDGHKTMTVTNHDGQDRKSNQTELIYVRIIVIELGNFWTQCSNIQNYIPISFKIPDNSCLVRTVIYLNGHFLSHKNMSVHPMDNPCLERNVIYLNDHFLLQEHMSVHPTDNHIL